MWKRIAQFIWVHGEAIIFAVLFLLVACVIGPSLDRYDAEHAKTAQR